MAAFVQKGLAFKFPFTFRRSSTGVRWLGPMGDLRVRAVNKQVCSGRKLSSGATYSSSILRLVETHAYAITDAESCSPALPWNVICVPKGEGNDIASLSCVLKGRVV